jgi:hypothetical protein
MQASLLNTYLVSTTISLPTNTNATCVAGLRFRQVGMTVHVIMIGGKPDQTRPSIKFRSAGNVSQFSSTIFSLSLCEYFSFAIQVMTSFSSPSYTTMPRNRGVCSQQTRVLRDAQCTCQCHFD